MALFKRKPLEKVISQSLSSFSDRRYKPAKSKAKKELAEALARKKEERLKQLSSATKPAPSTDLNETNYETLLKSVRDAEARDAEARNSDKPKTETPPQTGERRNFETRPFTNKVSTSTAAKPLQAAAQKEPELRQSGPPEAPPPSPPLSPPVETEIQIEPKPIPTPNPLSLTSGPAMTDIDPYDSETDLDASPDYDSSEDSEPTEKFERRTSYRRDEDYDVSAEYDGMPRETNNRFEPPLRPSKTRSRADINALRTDVDSLVSDLQNGESLYRRAQTRIENLSRSVEEAESGFTLLNRLQPENLRLKTRNKLLIKDFDKVSRQLKMVESELEDHKKWLSEKTEKAELLTKQLSQSNKSLHEYEHALKESQREGDQYRIDLVQAESKLDIERRENDVLKKRLVILSDRLEERNIQSLEVKKTIDSLKDDWEDFRSDAQRLERENADLRNKLDDAVRAKNSLKGQGTSMAEDIRNLKTQYEFDMIARDEQILALEGRIRDLTRENEIKDSIVRETARDMAELKSIRSRQQFELENKRYDHIDFDDDLDDDDDQDLYSAIAFDPDAEDRPSPVSRRSKASYKSDSQTNIDKHYEEISAALSKLQNPKSTQDSPDAAPAAAMSKSSAAKKSKAKKKPAAKKTAPKIVD